MHEMAGSSVDALPRYLSPNTTKDRSIPRSGMATERFGAKLKVAVFLSIWLEYQNEK